MLKRYRGLIVVLVMCVALAGCLRPEPVEPVEVAIPAPMQAAPAGPKKVAALVADWFPGSHPDAIIARIFKTYTLDGQGEASQIELVSVYRDIPSERDVSAKYAEEYGFKISESIEDALTLGTGTLAVDGVLLSTEWASYPKSDTGQTMYPHRQMFEEVVKVFKASGRVVPVFVDKHLADTWEDSKWIYDTAAAMGIPLMAGSSVPTAWRQPPVAVSDEKPLKEIVGVSYHTLDGYGFHALEAVQTIAEARMGGETGIASVQCLVDGAVWEAEGVVYDPELLQAALSRQSYKIPEGKHPRDVVRKPVLFVIDYNDGLRVNVFCLDENAARQWSGAWRYADGTTASTQFWLQQEAPGMHFAIQMKGIEDMILTGRPSWPAERTLLTSGVLDALLISKRDGSVRIKTPQLGIRYTSDWQWQQPVGP